MKMSGKNIIKKDPKGLEKFLKLCEETPEKKMTKEEYSKWLNENR
jgi:hypothetical protein